LAIPAAVIADPGLIGVGTPGSTIGGAGGIMTPLLTVVIFSYYLQARIEKGTIP
jgi:hypothetical protein